MSDPKIYSTYMSIFSSKEKKKENIKMKILEEKNLKFHIIFYDKFKRITNKKVEYFPYFDDDFEYITFENNKILPSNNKMLVDFIDDCFTTSGVIKEICSEIRNDYKFIRTFSTTIKKLATKLFQV